MNVTYDFDVVLWDTIGGAYTSESMNRASGGSEKEVVQLAEGLAKRGFRVICFNATEEADTHDFSLVGGGILEWRNKERWTKNIRCKVLIIQRYSTLPDPSQILPDRMVVRATDAYGSYYDHLCGLTHLCVSNWQASKFREAGFVGPKVIPAMLDDDYYELAKVEKVKGRFIFASAWMKGLDETIRKWQILKRRLFIEEMKGCELHITSPGYGKEQYMFVRENFEYDKSIVFLDDLPPRELAEYMATCEGLFYVNTFPECHPMVIGVAQAVGCRVHVLAKNGVAGCAEAAIGYVTDDERVFDVTFIDGLRGEVEAATPKDFRVSTVMPQWLAALHLESSLGSGVSEMQVQSGLQVIRDTDMLQRTAYIPEIGVKKNAEAKVDAERATGGSSGASPSNAQGGSDERSVGGRGESSDSAITEASLARPRSSSLEESRRALAVSDQRPSREGDAAVEDFPREVIEDVIGEKGVAYVANALKHSGGFWVTKPGTKERETEEALAIEANLKLRECKRLEGALYGILAEKKEKNAVNAPTICLVMLAKNAESTIRRALESVKGFVDSVCIQFDDTSTSEEMQEIVRNTLGPDFHFRFAYQAPQLNFAAMRNHLLTTAAVACPSDYQLTIDSDDVFVIDPRFSKADLVADGYAVTIHDGGLQYNRNMLWKTGAGEYRGAAHEIFYLAEGKTDGGTLPEENISYLRYSQNLTTDQTRAKFMRDTRALIAELKVVPNEPRSTYYLGQSLEDASCGADEGLLKQALRVYNARTKLGGSLDEQFISFLKVARLRNRFGMHGVVEAYEGALGPRPDRALEAMLELVQYHITRKEFTQGVAAAQKALALRGHDASTPVGFLVDVAVYRWRFDFEYGLAAFYTGDKPLAKKLWEALLVGGRVPVEQHSVLQSNLKFCEDSETMKVVAELEGRLSDPTNEGAEQIDGPLGKFTIPSSPTLTREVALKISRHVFDGEYEHPHLPIQIRSFIDIGAGWGAFSVWARSKWLRAEIYAYEPHGAAADLYEQNVQAARLMRVAVTTAENAYLGAPNGYSSEDWGALSTVNPDGNGSPVSVLHPRDLPPVDLLKVDAEGVELEILQSYAYKSRLRACMYEWHSQADREHLHALCQKQSWRCLRDQPNGEGATAGISLWIKDTRAVKAVPWFTSKKDE